MRIEQIRPWPVIRSQIGGINTTSHLVDVLETRHLSPPDRIRSWWGEDITPVIDSFLRSPRAGIFFRHLGEIMGSSVPLSKLMVPLGVRNGSFALFTKLFIVPREINWDNDKESGVLSLSFGLGEATGDAYEPLYVPKNIDVFGIGFRDPTGQLGDLLSQSAGVVPIQSTLGFR